MAENHRSPNWTRSPNGSARASTRTRRTGNAPASALRAASNLVRTQTGRDWLNDDGTLDNPLPEQLVDVTVACAARFYLNPNAETQWSRQIDDAMDGGSRKVDEPGMSLTASEKPHWPSSWPTPVRSSRASASSPPRAGNMPARTCPRTGRRTTAGPDSCTRG